MNAYGFHYLFQIKDALQLFLRENFYLIEYSSDFYLIILENNVFLCLMIFILLRGECNLDTFMQNFYVLNHLQSSHCV